MRLAEAVAFPAVLLMETTAFPAVLLVEAAAFLMMLVALLLSAKGATCSFQWEMSSRSWQPAAASAVAVHLDEVVRIVEAHFVAQ